LHESIKDQALIDEEVLEECAYEKIFQEDPNEAYHVEGQEDNIMSYDLFKDLEDNMFHDPRSEEASDIDTFILIGKHGWDMILLTFNGDPTYDVEGSPQTKDWYLCIYDLDVWNGDGEMITYFFHPFEDDLMQRF
jgi:hypothetical protein